MPHTHTSFTTGDSFHIFYHWIWPGLDQIYHPNIQADGKICLNILREDWKPVLTLNSVMVGLQYLLLEPNADDPLNKEAAEDLRSNRRNFESNVHKSIRGGSVNGVQYDNVMTKK